MAVTNPYYEFTPDFIPGTKARSDDVNVQFQSLQNAFDLLPSDADAITTGTSTFAPESGSGNAYVVTMPNTRTSEQDGDEVIFFATHTNTGAATLEVDGLGAKAIVRADGNAVTANDLQNGILYVLRYDASNTRYQLVGPSTSYLTDAAASAAAAAVSETNAATSETNAAASAALAQEWAVNPEDDDVTGFPGQFSAFHWAQKALAVAAFNRINVDITTATPPTTEAVTGALEYYDADDTDLLAKLGFEASNALWLRNKMRGGDVVLTAQEADGSEREAIRVFATDNVAVALSYNSFERLRTSTSGAQLKSIANTDTSARRLDFTYQNGTITGWVGQSGEQPFRVHNSVHGASVFIEGENTPSGVTTTMIEANPDAGVDLYYDGEIAIRTEQLGATIRDANVAGTNPTLVFQSQAGATQGSIKATNAELQLLTAPGELGFRAVNNSAAYVYYDSQFALNTNSAGIDVRDPTNVDGPTIGFYDFGLTRRAYINAGAAAFELYSENDGLPVRINADDAGGTKRAILDADPDSTTVLRADTDLILQVNAGETGVFVGANGGVDLFYNNTSVFRTTALGEISLYGDTDTDADVRQMNFRQATGLRRGYLGYNGGSVFRIANEIHGGNILIDAEDSGGNARSILNGDPDGVTRLYYNGTHTLETTGLGDVSIYGDANADADVRLLSFRYPNGTLKARIGHNGAGTLIVENEVTDGGVTLITNSSGTNLTAFSGTGSATVVRAGSLLDLQVGPDGSSEVAVRCTVNAQVDLYYNNSIAFRTTSYGAECLGPLKVGVVSNATRPAAGFVGRIVFNTDDGQLNIDDGTNWTLPDGTTT